MTWHLWTDKPPTKPGYYWVHHVVSNEQRIMQLLPSGFWLAMGRQEPISMLSFQRLKTKFSPFTLDPPLQ